MYVKWNIYIFFSYLKTKTACQIIYVCQSSLFSIPMRFDSSQHNICLFWGRNFMFLYRNTEREIQDLRMFVYATACKMT